jgi:Fe-S cluster assembly ATPase SufC
VFIFRSLVALSLILSLLLFRPAPLYILDEVDAALDLSHTQNIGQMLRTHFKQSQVGKILSVRCSILFMTSAWGHYRPVGVIMRNVFCTIGH